jgi:hypothetical protein
MNNVWFNEIAPSFIRKKYLIICERNQTMNVPSDVRITLRVTKVMLPPTSQPGAHEDHLPTKVGQYVGSKEGFLMNKVRREKIRKI